MSASMIAEPSSSPQSEEAGSSSTGAIGKFVFPSQTSSFEFLKKKFPESQPALPFGEPLSIGRSFSLTQLDAIDDVALANYHLIREDCTPIPTGFWDEMGRIDSTLTWLITDLERSLLNEEWVFRQLGEGFCPVIILKRYLLNIFF